MTWITNNPLAFYSVCLPVSVIAGGSILELISEKQASASSEINHANNVIIPDGGRKITTFSPPQISQVFLARWIQ